MKLKSVVINKYKSFLVEQKVEIEENITRLVGKNESGKTAFLEALAKFNYFEDDPDFKFNDTFDFPKNEWKNFQKSGEDIEVVKCTFVLDENLLSEIEKELGSEVFKTKEFSLSIKYKGDRTFSNVIVNEEKFIANFLDRYELDNDLKIELAKSKNVRELLDMCKGKVQEVGKLLNDLNEFVKGSYDWSNLVEGYIAKKYLSPNIPKFWYFDEYLTLPSKININKLKNGVVDPQFPKEELNISKALFELSNIDINELLNSNSFESFISELEATSNQITDELFEFWSTNKNLEIKFEIEPIIEKNSNGVIIRNEKILNIRIRNTKHRVSLPLKNRSKGFIWFFSFLVWFSKIQNLGKGKYILLLDEPGLNLHAAAQSDLLRFIEERLSKDYQVIYTTHSPFMIDPTKLNQIRTVYDSMDPKVGSIISDAIQEKDPDTLFPLQAALGYDIAQNLYISKNNLLVEGPADLLYLTVLTGLLESLNRTGLRNDITIVPVGGLDKVSTFISLLRGNKLVIACLLDNFTDQKGKQKVEDLIKYKIIKENNIRFFNEFADVKGDYADIEDLFEKKEYLELFNNAFDEYSNITLADIDKDQPIIPQINKIINKNRFNHFRPANKLVQLGVGNDYFSPKTLDRFEKMFIEINKLF